MLLSTRNICLRCHLLRPAPLAAIRPSVLTLKRPPQSLRYASTAEVVANLAHTRNIGIIAHIDAVCRYAPRTEHSS